MKRKNFPGRKMQRRIDAAIRAERPALRTDGQWTAQEMMRHAAACTIRTKKAHS